MSARSRRATFNLGDSIEVILGVHKGRQGIVRFSGVTQFAKGKWLGVELPVPKGKNDGSVQGVKYFTCKPKHGLFVKPTMVKLVKKGGSSASSSSSSSASASVSASAAPASSPTSETTPSSSTPARSRPGLTRQGSRTRTTRSSGPRSGAGTPSSSSRTRASPASSRRSRGEGASSGGAEAEAAPVAAAASGVTARELEEARGEVAEKIAEIEKLEARVSKMQEKLSLVQSTVIELKRSEHAATKKVAELEEKAMEQEAIIETLTVDKDLAEETVEDMKAEMELLKETLETSQLELELQKQEQELNNEEFLQSLDKDDASVARIRLQNEQLTDALRQLRDVSVAEKKRFESTHEASKRKLAELSAEVSHLRDKAARLEKAETDIAELKEQLDAAAEYEQMVEDLSDKIMTIEGENEELSEQVRQLQDLAEANDEIEEGHVEYEKQLQDEIDNYEADVQELKQKLSTSKAKVTDLQKTVNQFRRVTQDLRAQMEALENQASSTESRSKEDLARSRAAFERTLKVQAQIGDLRVKSVEFGLGELEVRQAKRQLDFLRAYIPSNMQVDMRSLNFLSRLDSCDYKCQLLSRLLAQFYGADMATTAGGERDGMMLCEFGCSVAHTLLRLQSALLTLTNKLHVATRENYNGALKRFSMLDSVEFALDTLLQTVGDDKISLSTPVDPLEEAIATVRKFTETYFGEDNVADALPRADSALGVSLSVQRLRFQMIGAKSRLRVIGLYVAQIAGVSDDDSSDGNAEQAQANFDSLEDTHIRTQAAVDSVLDRAAELMLRGKTFSTVPSLKAALNESSSSSDTFIASAEQLEVKANEVISRAAEPTEAAPEVAHVIELHGTATREALQAVQASLETLVQELDSRIAEADRAASSGPSSPKAAGGSAAAIWEKHAEETRKELEAAATLKDELERNKSAIEAKAQELAAANKRAREHQKQMDMLTQRLQLVEQRAGTSTQLEADLKRLKEQENEHRELLDTLQSDIEKYTTENKTLKTDLATAQLQQARGVPNGLASGGRSAAFAASASGAPDASASSSVSSAEVLVLRRTVGLLRKQIAALRSEKAVRELEQSLPPLNTRRTRIRPRGMYTEAQFAAIEAMERRVSHAEEKRQKQLHVYRENLKKYAHQSRRLRSAPVLVNLAKVDPADPATASAASAKFFSRRSKLEAVSAKVRGLKNAFLSALGADVEHLDANRGKIAESGEVPVPVGRIRVPRAAAEAAGATLASQRLEVGKKELAQLQAIFV